MLLEGSVHKKKPGCLLTATIVSAPKTLHLLVYDSGLHRAHLILGLGEPNATPLTLHAAI
jgi:hypothetical protein